MSNQIATKAKTKITADTAISDLIDSYPLVVDYLVEEYGFFCFNCFLAGYETIAEGARVHGIVDDELDEMLMEINEMVVGKSGRYSNF